MSCIPVPARLNDTPSTSRSSLPTFEPLSQRRSKSRDGRPESSASGSCRSHSNGKSGERIEEVNKNASAINSQVDAESLESKLPSRRVSHRSSGGFLLGSIRRSSRIPRVSSAASEDLKGKRKGEDTPPVSVPKTRARHVQTQSGSSIASSPLATEVHPESITSNGNARLIPGTDVRKSIDISRPQTVSSGTSSGQHLEIRRPSPPVFGYDTDPSQIVNMALSLSEARRRQASMKRYVSTHTRGRRVVSAASANSNRSSRIPTGSLAQYITPARPKSATPSTENKPSTSHSVAREPLGAEGSPENDTEVADLSFLDQAEISEATVSRVQRAKTYFELAYEHRRLLPHLPPVRRPGAYVRSQDLDLQTKAYNPLQYVRNRKLRIWDKTTFDAEADGWHDVEKVKKWVNAVIDGHHESRNDPAECVRLPPLTLADKPTQEEDPSDTKDRPSQPSGPPKPRRPRSDWITHPGDMLADCFWLEQGVNKIKIRDRDNNQIYPPDTQFRFSGWRNLTPIQVPDNLQQPTPPESDDEPDPVEEPLHSPVAELPTFKSAHQSVRGKPHHRGSRKLKESLAAMEDGGNKRKGLRLFMDDTSDEEDSEQSPGSPGGGRERGRGRLTRKRQRRRSTSRSTRAEPLTTTSTKDSIFASTRSSDRSQPSSAQHSKRTSLEQSRFGHYLKGDSTKGHTPLSRSQNRAEHNRQESSHKFPSFNDRPRSSAEYDTTAPNSPVTAGFPSIAISLESPPQSRSPSPHKKKASILHPFRDRSHGRHGHDKVSATDFADLSQVGSRQISGEADKHHSDGSPGASRGTSPMTRGQSPLSKGLSHATQSDSATTGGDYRESTVSRVSTKSTAPSSDHSKIRGMFKGGRIAELVGNEVSRVGEFIWKRDPPAHRRRGSSSTASTRSLHDSDTDEGRHANGDIFKTPRRPRTRSRRASTLSSTKSEQFTSPVSSKSPQSGERPKFHNPNLPSFTSPFEKDKEAQEQKKQALLTPTTSLDENRDHISRLAANHRSASRSPRLDKLAPPKLDTGRTTSPMGLRHQNSYGFGESLALQRSRDASDKFNSAISIDAHGLRGPKSAADLSRISTKELPSQADEAVENVTIRDIDRAIALLLCSAVKAREIGRRADMPREKAPEYLLESLATDGTEHHHVDLSLVSRREEHVVAARMVMSRLSTQAAAFEATMKRFSSNTAPALHRGLQELEDLVDNKLTPRVRTSADEAGELSMKLSTTSTMAIKGLNDTIDVALRRRRRGPVRWVRRLWYASIEYTVVSLLWGIWAVVSVIRVVMAIFTGSTRVVRWLLWID